MNWLNFTINWWAGAGNSTLGKEAYWSTNMNSGAVSGPVYQNSSTHGPDYGGFIRQQNWFGWEFWNYTTGEQLMTLTQVGAYENGASFTNKASSGDQYYVPSGAVVESVDGAWVGFSPYAGGGGTNGGGLLQTGYAIDASNWVASYCIAASPYIGDCNYGLWWQDFAPGQASNTPSTSYTGHPTAYYGDILALNVYQNAPGSVYWSTYVRDQSSQTVWTHSFNIGSGYSPHYGDFIVETPQLCLGSNNPQTCSVSQTAQINNYVAWENGFVNHDKLVYDYNSNHFNIYQLNDCQSWWGALDDNTNQNFMINQNGWYGTSSWPQVTFNNAAYDWQYVNPHSGGTSCPDPFQ
jgi:hypothetical protein